MPTATETVVNGGYGAPVQPLGDAAPDGAPAEPDDDDAPDDRSDSDDICDVQ